MNHVRINTGRVEPGNRHNSRCPMSTNSVFSDKAPNVEYRGPSLKKKVEDTTVAQAPAEPSTTEEIVPITNKSGLVVGVVRGLGGVLSMG